MRILVTGSRSWDRPEPIWSILDILAKETAAIGDELTVVHGACFPTPNEATGRMPEESADYLAELWCRRHDHPLDVTVERHPANWARCGKRAGFVRNQEMVRLGADLVLAFLRDESPGTTRCIELAEGEGLVVQVIHYEDVTP